MPIRPEMKDRYPDDWPQIRARILNRDGHACKFCGVKNHALGGRLASGRFVPAMPTGEHTLGLLWPEPGTRWWCKDRNYPETHHLIIIRIVLTVAHLRDPSPENCADDNLAALCQRCHNILDAPMRARNRAEAARRALPIDDLFGGGGC